jgi:8-oxo-dGTP pyrophosphatase MutT (NUDIX family)
MTPSDIRGRFGPATRRPDRILNRRGDDDMNPGMGRPAILRAAAVLVPIVEHPDGATVLFTQRTAHLTSHAGQISFPGGRIEATDHSAEHAALRETEEEIGLPQARVEVLGRLDVYVTRTGFEVTPIVGLIRPPFILEPDANEVAEVFEVPLAFILDPANCERHHRDVRGETRGFWVFPYGERYIWGATAGMLLNLRDRLGA